MSSSGSLTKGQQWPPRVEHSISYIIILGTYYCRPAKFAAFSVTLTVSLIVSLSHELDGETQGFCLFVITCYSHNFIFLNC